MRYVLAAIAIPILALALVMFYQYRTEISAIHQGVLSGSRVLSTAHGEIEYTVRGEGPPVLLIHGSGGGYDQGLLFGEMVLGEGYKEISVSRFGYLRSPAPEDFSARAQSAMYAALLDHLGIQRVVVLGGSAGGPSALQFAHDYPERTSALLLLSAVSKIMPPGEQDALQISIISTIQRSDFLYWLVARALQPQFLEMVGIPPDVYEGFTTEQRKLSQQLLDVMQPMSLRREGSVREAEIVPLEAASMGKISAPTLILHARDDKLVVYEHAEHAHRSIEQSKLVSYETGGHAMLTQITSMRGHVSAMLGSVSY
jgi:pimeloyl-ACP methyl ester carboxylesterase